MAMYPPTEKMNVPLSEGQDWLRNLVETSGRSCWSSSPSPFSRTFRSWLQHWRWRTQRNREEIGAMGSMWLTLVKWLSESSDSKPAGPREKKKSDACHRILNMWAASMPVPVEKYACRMQVSGMWTCLSLSAYKARFWANAGAATSPSSRNPSPSSSKSEPDSYPILSPNFSQGQQRMISEVTERYNA
ncbi:hypothetical protein B0H17DRAFT_1183215 [Mycena rosella]|uniref:Uncharacterized protein n=1 Tax=Mycena rosella TaxID=1033263 RepID=A0AAD7G793_MYCRO|nr:hypothetical protein B0H17DRAFT_1183215 [Mycena rosella]